MTMHWKISLALSLIAVILAAGLHAHALVNRNFPLPDAIVTDFTGTVFPDDIESIRLALMDARERNGMDGHVIIALSTEEWYLQEYAKDYADYLQGRGLIGSTGWLIYVSIADRKFAIAVQEAAKQSITPARLSEVELVLSEKLERGDVAGAVVDAVDRIGDLPSLRAVQDKKKIRPDMLFFMGIAVIVVVLMMRLRRHQQTPTKASR
jgi:uncharacterized membrane protein YgcG